MANLSGAADRLDLRASGDGAAACWRTLVAAVSARLRRPARVFVVLALLMLAIVLPVVLPQPQAELRLFSDGWGAASFMAGEVCSPDDAGGLAAPDAVLPKPAARADAGDRALLALRYLAWGLMVPVLLPALALQRRVREQQALLLVATLYGLAPAWFQSTLNPGFVALRQALAEFWLARWPMQPSDFAWLDGLSFAAWMTAGAAIGAAVCAVLTAAGRLAGCDRRALARSLLPLAGVLLVLGLTQPTALYLRGEGLALDWLPSARAALLAAGLCWTSWLGARVIGAAPRAGWPGRAAAFALWLLPVALACLHVWAMYFHWVSRYSV
ncbi:hypothetical protein [Rubrivivax gelatinosus]|uniref:hypothetical protein n=1 Tax=Rubrivivax gelatinosus TaxID=28068 RepID=UPI001F5BDBDB|nr:hypothetical protein [Rubrivivax gelatinosus]